MSLAATLRGGGHALAQPHFYLFKGGGDLDCEYGAALATVAEEPRNVVLAVFTDGRLVTREPHDIPFLCPTHLPDADRRRLDVLYEEAVACVRALTGG
jgi:hypothetical protein